MATCSPDELLAAAKCFTPLNEQQKQAVRLVLLCRILQAHDPMATCDVQELLTAARCFQQLNEQQQMAVLLQLECEILNAGGSSTTSCNLCFDGEDPVDPPSCDCAIGTRLDTGELFVWHPTLAT